MLLDPKDYRTWTVFADHPIFDKERDSIEEWSHDASRYSELKNYGVWMPECYIHITPSPSLDIQSALAKQDIEELASCLLALEQAFGSITYELVILDDFTVYVWVAGNGFALEIYPNNLMEPNYRFLMFIEHPVLVDEVQCRSIADVVANVRNALVD